MSLFGNRLPSTTALRVLLAIAERGSTTAAAEATHLTQSAVSKQLLAFERLIGQPLFMRTTQGMVLTEVGLIYREQAQIALKALEDATLRVSRLRPNPKSLRLQVLPIFGDRWLLPRFAGFAEQHPGVDVQFTTFVSATQSEGADGIFRFGTGTWPGEKARYLFGNDVALVGAPSYWAKVGVPQGLDDLRECVMLEHPQTRLHWQDFAAFVAAPALQPKHTIQFGFYTMVIRAAFAGQGMALIPRGLILEDLAAGRLVNPLSLGYRNQQAYWFTVPEHGPPNRPLATFADWLFAEVAAMPPEF